jgi:flavodoxin
MRKAAIVYHSRTGTTRALADDIARVVGEGGYEVQIWSAGEVESAALVEVDLLLLGCWTSGWFVIMQHPEASWVEFARRLPALKPSKVGLFTTYRLATGTMFRGMRRHLRGKVPEPGISLRSRSGRLSAAQEKDLKRFLAE